MEELLCKPSDIFSGWLRTDLASPSLQALTRAQFSQDLAVDTLLGDMTSRLLLSVEYFPAISVSETIGTQCMHSL